MTTIVFTDRTGRPAAGRSGGSTKRNRARIICLEAKLRGQTLDQAKARAEREGIHPRTTANAWWWAPAQYAGMEDEVREASDRFLPRTPGRMTMREIRRIGRGLPELTCLAGALHAEVGVGQVVEKAPFPTLDISPEWRPMIDALIKKSEVEMIIWWPNPVRTLDGSVYRLVYGLASYAHRWVCSPVPRDHRSLGILVHELGHVILGCPGGDEFGQAIAEIEAETFAIRELTTHGIDVSDHSRRYLQGYTSLARTLWEQGAGRGRDPRGRPLYLAASVIDDAYAEHEERARNRAAQMTLC